MPAFETPEYEFLSDGLREELISALTNIRRLRVVARTSAFQFKGKALDIRWVGFWVQKRRGKILVATADRKAPVSDNAPVSAVEHGDESAMALLYDRYSSLVYSIALRVLRDADTAEDVLQEVFMQLWRRPTAFDSSRSRLGTWSAVLTCSRAIDHLRQRRPVTNIDDINLSIDFDFAWEAEETEPWRKFGRSWKVCHQGSESP